MRAGRSCHEENSETPGGRHQPGSHARARRGRRSGTLGARLQEGRPLTAATDAASLRAAPDTPVLVLAPGRVPFRTARGWQRRLAQRRAAGGIGDVLLLLEHPSVYTAGRRAVPEDLLWDGAERARRGVDLVEVDRGGQLTYHGPGQLVGYPVVRLADRRVGDWMRALEEVNLRLARSYGLAPRRAPGRPGVWVGEEKLTAVGARVLASRVTQHGWATNVTTDLSYFDGIVPCGLPDGGVCSLRSCGLAVDLPTVLRDTARHFGDVFGCSLDTAQPREVARVLRAPEQAPRGRLPRLDRAGATRPVSRSGGASVP